MPSLWRWHGPGCFSAGIRADGPAEALFRFCAEYKISPAEVEVTPQFRHPGFEYVCSVGKPPDWWSPYVTDPFLGIIPHA